LVKAWVALRVLSPNGCRPFSHDRSGLVLGEGAGIVVLESEDHARSRGARVYAELAGFGLSADAGHITDPSPDGAAAAMRAALADAGLAITAIDYINAHGTGTRANDRSETRAIRQVFGADADRLAVSSTKAAHGHALGASGALELIATTLAIRDGVVPPTLNYTGPGEGCDLNYVPNLAQVRPVGAALSNSFAFGGLNGVLALRRYA
jgi:nodulation protein E